MVVTPMPQSPTRLSVRTALWISLGLLLSLAPGAFANPLTLAWDESAGAAGYLIYYGSASRNYTANRVGRCRQHDHGHPLHVGPEPGLLHGGGRL